MAFLTFLFFLYRMPSQRKICLLRAIGWYSASQNPIFTLGCMIKDPSNDGYDRRAVDHCAQLAAFQLSNCAITTHTTVSQNRFYRVNKHISD